MIKKRKLAKNKYSVTFTTLAVEGVAQMYLVGDFNEWSETGTPMQKAPDGSWSVKLTLEGGRDYQYRYRDNNGTWHNDWQADGYERNTFGTDNSVVNLMDGATPMEKVSAHKKKLL